jgi:hypothetical protein
MTICLILIFSILIFYHITKIRAFLVGIEMSPVQVNLHIF